MSIAPVIANSRTIANSASGQAARLQVVRREHDRERDDRDEQQVQERRQPVDHVGAAEARPARAVAAGDGCRS